jgi:MoxR-like ATPase
MSVRYDTTHEASEALLAELSAAVERIKAELAKTIVGQDEAVELLLVSLLTGGHILLTGAPGLARTSIISALSAAADLSFSRIQFTPDMLPSDVTGSEIIEENRAEGGRDFRFLKGPIFANLILADEINRTPPKTQAALIEAMEEHQVTAGNRCFKLEEPFMVMATLNIVDQEGVYGLPEGSPQLDRFMFKVRMPYPTRSEESEIIARTTGLYRAETGKVISRADLLRFQRAIRRMPAAPHVKAFALDLAQRTRPSEAASSDFVRRTVAWGAGPRASQHLVLGAKALAAAAGRPAPTEADVARLAAPVLRHRVVLNFHAGAEGLTADDLARRVVDETKAALLAGIPLRGRSRKLVGV